MQDVSWRCPTPECNGAKLRSVNSLQRDESVMGLRRRIYKCQTCGRNVSTEERIVNPDRRSSYLPRPGQYKGKRS